MTVWALAEVESLDSESKCHICHISHTGHSM